MINKIKLLTAIAVLLLLSACGGGGDGGGDAQVLSTGSFNLQAAYKSNFTATNSYKFNISGTYGSFPVSGSGSAIVGAVTSGVFEGQSALQHTTSILGSFLANGQTIPLATSAVYWVDTNYMPRGSVATEYVVINGTATIPTAAKVNDTGSLYVANRYRNSTKTQLLGTTTVTYVVEADTATTALVTLISVDKNTNGTTTQTSTEQYRVTTANTITKIKETTVDNLNSLNLTLTVVN
jgi:hypothetical protein